MDLDGAGLVEILELLCYSADRILQTHDAFNVFIHANNFLPQLYDVFPATNRLVHVCAAVLPAQSKSGTP